METVTQISLAKKWLIQQFESNGGTLNTEDVYKNEDFSRGTLYRAATSLGVVSTRGRKWSANATWTLGE